MSDDLFFSIRNRKADRQGGRTQPTFMKVGSTAQQSPGSNVAQLRFCDLLSYKGTQPTPLWLTLYRNSAWREGIGIDFCIGQFDTAAWRSSTDRQRCNNRAHFLEHLRGLEAAGWSGSGRWAAMRQRGHGRARPPRLLDTLTLSRTRSTLVPMHRQRAYSRASRRRPL